MTLNEAIEHLETKDEVLAKQLTNWLRELREYRKGNIAEGFSRKKYLKNPTRKIYLLDSGAEVRIIATDVYMHGRLTFLASYRKDNKDVLCQYDDDGYPVGEYKSSRLVYKMDYDHIDETYSTMSPDIESTLDIALKRQLYF